MLVGLLSQPLIIAICGKTDVVIAVVIVNVKARYRWRHYRYRGMAVGLRGVLTPALPLPCLWAKGWSWEIACLILNNQ